MQIETDDYLTLAQAAIRLDLSKERVRQLVVAGDLAGVRLTLGWLVSTHAVEAYAQRSKRA